MRLRNIKNAHDIIRTSNYLVTENPFEEVEIEIGMGKGDFIINKAIQNPNINFIGIEVYATVLVSAVKKLEEYNLPNLKIMNIDAIDIDKYFKNNVSKIYLNFSDPWPKKRHTKRRLTSDTFLEKYKNIFKGDYIIEMKTDNRNLFEYSLINLSQNDYKLESVSLDLYKELDLENVQTEYEKKFSSMGLPIYKLKVVHKVDKKNKK